MTGRGKVTLKVSQGVHSGSFTCFIAGGDQRELIIAGRAATTVTDMETAADAGDILVSPATAGHLPPSSLGDPKGPGVLLKRSPGACVVPDPVALHPDGDPPERFLAPAIRTRVQAGIREAEHRHVTVGFVHVFGLDDLIDDVGSVDVLGRLDRLVRIASQRADETGACLIATDIAGDGTKLILTAGAPDAIEDGEGNMLSVVRAVLDEVDDLGLHAGVCAGHVFAGEVGAPFRAVYTVIGDTVNLSARLMAKAGPGELYGHTPTVEQSDVMFQTVPLEPFFVKGKSRPIEAMSIGERLGVREQRTHVLDVGFIGRDRELGRLDDLLAAARTGRGGCVDIVGEAGVGKSRLVGAFTSSVDVRTTRLTCESFQTERPYFMTRILLRRVLGIEMRAEPDAAGRHLEQVIGQAAPELLPHLPLLGLAADASVPPTSTVDQISPEHRANVMADVIERLLRALVDQTHILVVENCEWMDDASAHVFARVLRSIDTSPWLAILTSRGGETGLHVGLGYKCDTIQLASLTERDVVDLARTAFGATPVPDHEIDEICRRSAGNPLYLLELVNARMSVGSLEEIPTSLQDLVTSRIDRLDPYDRRVLRYTSVLGSRFPPELARIAFEADVPDIADEQLWSRLGDFLVVERGGDLRFTHELLRDVAYSGLPFERRRELHERVGLALEEQGGAASDDLLSTLSLHFDRARDGPRAWRYSRDAATRAAEKYANLEAVTFLERAIEHGRTGVAPPDRLADAAEELGDVRSIVGQFDRAANAYSYARSLRKGDSAHLPRLLRKQGVVRVQSGRYTAALGWYRRGMRAAEALRERQRDVEEAELAAAYAGVRYRQGKLAECARWSRDAVDSAQRGGDRRTEAHAYYLLEAALADMGDPAAETVRGLALPIFEELGDLRGQGNVLNNLGVDLHHAGDWEEAADHWTRARVVRQRAGDVLGLADISYNLGDMRSDQGRFDQAEALLDDALRTYRAAEYPFGIGATLSGIGRVHIRLGQFDSGFALLKESLEIFDEMRATLWSWELDAKIGEGLAFAGRWEEAAARIERLLAENDLGPAPSVHSIARRSLGLAAAGLHDRERAVHELTLARDVARSGNAQFDAALSAFERARVVDDDIQRTHDRELAAKIFRRLDVDATRVVAPMAVTSG